jgi:hypothetical protein
MLGTARLLGQTTGAAVVALLLARYPAGGTQIALLVGVGFAMFGAALSTLRPSPTGALESRVYEMAPIPRRGQFAYENGDNCPSL